MNKAMVVVAALFALVAQTGGQAQSSDPLTYSRGFLLTGNFVVSSVDLPRGGGQGAITFTTAKGNAIPAESDLAAAFLYWEALAPVGAPHGPARFHGQEITSAKATRQMQLPPTGTANCWGSSGNANRVITMYRGDVLALLPKQYDADDKWTGRYIVNDIAHPIELGIAGSGNTLTTIAGATLLLVYRNPAEPLRKIVIYDGVHTQQQGTTTLQRMTGFYRSVPDANARIAHIVGSGAGNSGERLLFNGQVISAANPIPTPVGTGSDRGWASPVFNVGSLMPLAPNSELPGYGEYVITGIDHGATNQNATPYECLAWAGMVFSTAVADGDRDGLPDRLEEEAHGLKDPATAAYPNGQPLPDLFGMGARKNQKDLLVEINAMTAVPNTSYGSAAAPFSTDLDVITDSVGHNHMPTPAVLKRVGESLLEGQVHVHFDVGDWTRYQSLGPDYACLTNGSTPECNAQPYLVPSGLARGGEFITERAAPNGLFSDYPGTIGWPFGVQLVKEAPVGNGGEERTNLELRNGQAGPNGFPSWDKGQRRRRFDANREDYFRYALYAHARGKTRLPCVDSEGTARDFNAVDSTGAGVCMAPALANNPQYPHVPFSGSGVAHLPGNMFLVTLGLWDRDRFVGSEFVQASTTLHEIGHTINLWHGSYAAVFGNKAQGTSTRVEPNCKPNYLSSMSYMFQVHGMFDNLDRPHLGYSDRNHTPALTENTLSEATFSPAAKYRTAWFVPATADLAATQGASAARRFCNGGPFDQNAPPQPVLARVQAPTVESEIDWDGDGDIEPSVSGDVNFDGDGDGVLQGANDWANVRLDQIGAARVSRLFSSPNGDLIDFGSGDLLDFGSGDLIDFGSGDLIDFGSGTHLVHFGSGDFLKYGSGDLIDFGSGDLIDFGSGVFMSDGAAGGENGGDLIDFGSGDLIDFGSGDLIDFGSGDLIDFGSGDLIDFGSGDLIDFGTGDLLDFGSGTGLQELDLPGARALGAPRPYGLAGSVLTSASVFPGNRNRVQLTWSRPTFDAVTGYNVYRAIGEVPPNSSVQPINNAPVTATTYIDTTILPDGEKFTYWVRAIFVDGSLSPTSTPVVVTAVNTPPVAVNDPPPGVNTYSTTTNTSFSIPATAGVLVNDTDVDGPRPAGLRALLTGVQANADGSLTVINPAVTINADGSVTGPTAQGGVVTLRQDGSLSYTPRNGFSGADTFTYRTDNGVWTAGKSVVISKPPSAPATVQIQVQLRRR